MTVTINIKDDKLEEFFQEADAKGWLDDHEEPSEIPQWQIDEVLRRRAENKLSDYRPWREVIGEIRSKHGPKTI